MITKAREFKIGELGKATGVKIETIRYYERIGVLAEPIRNSNGQRYYLEKDLKRLAFVRRARELGFSIEDIRALLKLAAPGQQLCAEVKSIASAHLSSVQAKIGDLVRLERILSATVAQCDDAGSLQCPVLEMLDATGNSVTS